jgi:hypothetical protein
MSRTYKKYTGGCFRNPRGHKQAMIAGVPKRAVPPSSYDDISYDKQCWLPYKVADGLAAQAVSYWEVVRHIKLKFGLRQGDAEWIAEMGWWTVQYERRNIPEGLLIIAKEKELK